MSLDHNNQQHVLIVDDDGEIRQLVAKFLRGNGFRASTAQSGLELRQALAASDIDLIVLDVMLSGESGFDLCRQLRATSATPIIMLTAKGDEMDRIVGLEVGADDYVSKPFNPRELLARIKAVLRRSTGGLSGKTERQTKGFRFSGWTVDVLRRELTTPDNLLVELSGAEFDMLLAFVEAPNRILSRDHLLDAARNRVADSFDRSVDILVSRLRRKIERDSEGDPMIKTVRGAGYLFMPKVEPR